MINSFDDILNIDANYPPTDIYVTIDDGKTYLEVALAGFNKEDINVEINNGLLTIEASYNKEFKPKRYHSYSIYKKSFTRQFVLNNGAEVESAEMSNGMLTIIINYKQNKNMAKKIEVK